MAGATPLRFAAVSEEEGVKAAIAAYDRALGECPAHPTATSERTALVSHAFWEKVYHDGQSGGSQGHTVLTPYRTVTLDAAAPLPPVATGLAGGVATGGVAAGATAARDARADTPSSLGSAAMLPGAAGAPPPTAAAAATPLHSAHCLHWMDASACAEVIAAAEASDGWDSKRHTDYATIDIEVSTALHE